MWLDRTIVYRENDWEVLKGRVKKMPEFSVKNFHYFRNFGENIDIFLKKDKI